ncbi:anti-sigma factor family protein [Mycoplana dimorpha]|uniref:Anti-sigma factor RsiW n=1 Tax=Mycoplana dimorpha TaxID=28320 RepID=A0A2T5B139_MYCDI|nr:anti-sigma factor [Mycoplana dimorpha]PTM92690.1 anti-sigma factor RsiW [Mycoplana dimorpha]
MESTQGLPLEVRLSAYLDGQLPNAEISEIDRMLARDEQARTLFNRLKLGSDLGRKAFEDMLHEPVPLALVRSIKQAATDTGHEPGRTPLAPPADEARSYAGWTRIAASGLILLAVGAGAGYLLGSTRKPAAEPPVLFATTRNWLDELADDHRMYARQSRHLAEVPAARSAEIVEWLAAAVGVEFSIPDLSANKLDFEGGRLLVAGGRPTAQLLYKDEDGEIFSVCLQKAEPVPQRTDPVDIIRNDLGLVSWQQGAAAFVVIGPSSDPALETIAEAVGQAI